MIIFRYLAREIYSSLFAVTLILVFVFLVNQMIHWLSQAATGDLATNTLLKLLALQLPYLLGLLLPLGLYLGILICYSRLYAENEMTVMFASGLSRWQLTNMTLMIATVVFIVVSVLMMVINPIIANKKNDLLESTTTKSLVASLIPGSFQSIPGNKGVIYVGAISNDKKRAQNVFVAQRPLSKNKKNGWTIVSASDAEQEHKKEFKGDFIVASDGYRYQGVPGKNEYQVVKFGKYGLRLDGQQNAEVRQDEDAISTITLIKQRNKNLDYLSELQWRVSLPLSVYVLTLLGVALSKVRPRQGRFQQLAPAILVYIIYANLIFVARDWLEDGSVSARVGVWWVHLLFLVFALLLFAIQSNVVRRLLHRRFKVAA